MYQQYKNTAVICLSHNNGGMELASIKIAKLLTSSVETTIIARKDSFIHLTSQESNLDLETVNHSRYFSLQLVKEIRKIIIKKNIKNVIFLGASELKSLYFSFLGLDINLIIRQGTYKKSSKKDFFHRLIYSSVNYFIANSNYIMDSVKKVIPIAKHTQLKIIYASYRSQEIPKEQKLDDYINIIHLGRIVNGKGQKDAVIACSKLKNNNINFKCHFYGSIEDEVYFNEIQQYIKLHNLSENILFHGYSKNTQVALSKSDIFLFPTKGEGFSNAMIEAISYGLVVISYNNSSMPEMEKNGFHIHLAKDQNQEELNNKLEKIVSNIENEKKISFSNVNLAKDFFSETKEKDEYLQLLV